VLPAAVAGARRATTGSIVVVGVVKVRHRVFAYRRRTRRGQRIAHARRAACTTRVVGQRIAAACVARSDTSGRWRTGRGGLRVKAGVREWAGLHEARGEGGWRRGALMGGHWWMRSARKHASLLVAASRRARNVASGIAVVAGARVCTMGADRVQEGYQDTLFHELVDLGHSTVQGRRVRGDV
jgi:hypothetical protein